MQQLYVVQLVQLHLIALYFNVQAIVFRKGFLQFIALQLALHAELSVLVSLGLQLHLELSHLVLQTYVHQLLLVSRALDCALNVFDHRLSEDRVGVLALELLAQRHYTALFA